MNTLKKYEYKLENLDCAACSAKIEDALKKVDGLENVSVNFSKLKLTYETENVEFEKVKEIILNLEPEINITQYLNTNEHHHEHHHHEHHHHEHDECCSHNHNHEENLKIKSSDNRLKKDILRLIIGIILACISYLILEKNVKISALLLVISYAVLLYKTAQNAIKLLFKSKTINENLLITTSCIGAFIVGERFEGLMVILLYEIGKILENKAVNKSRKSIAKLMDIKPEYASRKVGEEFEKVNPEDVNINDIILIKKGEKVPLDGIIVKGESKLNTASLTGESKLRDVKVNDEILSGSINEGDILEVKVIKEYKDSTVNKILDMVENATDKKAKTETLVNKAAKIYTPIVIILAILVGIFLPIINTEVTYQESIYRALIFLVISCPCAIAISVPLSYFSGIGKSSKEGILIKGSDYLDALKDINVICLDKTGTITKGKFEVSNIKVLSNNFNEEYLLKLLALGESFTNHPIAKSILEYVDLKTKINYKDELDNVLNFEEISGKGLSYKYLNKDIFIGNKELVNYDEEIEEKGTIIFAKEGDAILGYVVLSDTIKDGVVDFIKKLKENNINSKMFTGDNLEIAKDIAEKVGINEVKAEMLPNEKYDELEKILNNNKNGKVSFVGDGINDSPVLARADIGIAMGGVGQESAIEASDVVIMTDDLNKIIKAIEISKKTNKIIKQNLIFAISIKIIVLCLSTLGLAGMWQAIFADVGVTLITIFNTLRILK